MSSPVCVVPSQSARCPVPARVLPTPVLAILSVCPAGPWPSPRALTVWNCAVQKPVPRSNQSLFFNSYTLTRFLGLGGSNADCAMLRAVASSSAPPGRGSPSARSRVVSRCGARLVARVAVDVAGGRGWGASCEALAVAGRPNFDDSSRGGSRRRDARLEWHVRGFAFCRAAGWLEGWRWFGWSAQRHRAREEVEGGEV